MPFEARYRIYWSETDAGGIAHFTSILRIVERAEEDFYASKGLGGLHRSLPRVELRARFRKPLRWGDTVRVVLRAEELRTRGLRYRFEIYNETLGALAAEGSLAYACAESDGQGLKAAPCPEDLLEAWRKT